MLVCAALFLIPPARMYKLLANEDEAREHESKGWERPVASPVATTDQGGLFILKYIFGLFIFISDA